MAAEEPVCGLESLEEARAEAGGAGKGEGEEEQEFDVATRIKHLEAIEAAEPWR